MNKQEQPISRIIQLIPTYKSLLSSLSSLNTISNSILANNLSWNQKYVQLKSLYLKNIDEQLNLENYLSEEAEVDPDPHSSFYQVNSRRKEELLLKIQTLQNDIFDYEKKLCPPSKGYQKIIEKMENEIQKVRGSIESIKNARSIENLQKELEIVLKQKKELEEGQGKKKGKEEKMTIRSAGVRKILPNSPYKGYLV